MVISCNTKSNLKHGRATDSLSVGHSIQQIDTINRIYRYLLMIEFKWDKKYEIGNFEIDAEHKVFVCIIQKIICAIENKKYKHVERLICEIIKYAEFHFYSEETVMMEINYPYIEEHQREHKQLLIELRGMIFIVGDKYKSDYFKAANKFVDFFIRWFTNHTANTDKKLADYINE